MADRTNRGSPMIRKLPIATLDAALAGVLALAGGNKADDTNDAAIDTTPPPAATTPADTTMPPATTDTTATTGLSIKIGRASCRERVCQYVSISVVAVSLQKKI